MKRRKSLPSWSLCSGHSHCWSPCHCSWPCLSVPCSSLNSTVIPWNPGSVVGNLSASFCFLVVVKLSPHKVCDFCHLLEFWGHFFLQPPGPVLGLGLSVLCVAQGCRGPLQALYRLWGPGDPLGPSHKHWPRPLLSCLTHVLPPTTTHWKPSTRQGCSSHTSSYL